MSVSPVCVKKQGAGFRKKTDSFEELGKNHYYVEASNNINSKYTVGAYIVD